jgi:raffinose/stachyose/melibiose transport system substrate-binding protein
MPDMWFNWGGSLAAPFIDGGHALEITPELAAKYGLDKSISPIALDLARHNGKLYVGQSGAQRRSSMRR